MKLRLPNFFLSYGQVGVGVNRGMEAAIYTLIIHQFKLGQRRIMLCQD